MSNNISVCETRTIERIVTHILSSDLPRFGGIPVGSGKAVDIGQALTKLNIQAFNTRYKSAEPEPVYRHTPRPDSSVQVLKSIVYLLSQSGDRPTDPVWADLKALRDSLALSVAQATPDYAKAEWG